MANKILETIMIIVVGVILLGSLLVVAIDTYSEEDLTYTNEGVPFKLMDDSEHTMVIENVGGDPHYTIDGESVTSPEYTFNNQSTVVYGEDGLFRVWKVGGGTARLRVQAADKIGLNLDSGQSTTVTFDSTNIVLNDQTAAIKPVAYLSPGNYSQTVKPFVNESSIVYIAGLTEGVMGVTSNYIAVSGGGTMDDFSVNVVDYVLTSDTTVTNVEWEFITIDEGNGLYQIDDIKLTFTLSDESTEEAHYTYFIAPTDVEYDNPNYIGDEYSGILGAIVIIAIASLLVLGVRIFLVGRD